MDVLELTNGSLPISSDRMNNMNKLNARSIEMNIMKKTARSHMVFGSDSARSGMWQTVSPSGACRFSGRHEEWYVYLFITIQGGSLLNSGFSFLAVDPLLLMYGVLRSYALLRAYQNRENAKIEEKWVALLPTRLITIE
ncbi:unnamed protein product [Brassica rapa]|uniref:Uncharacterized protein n=2 Tax=Brassica TaxID=3705 RepID=A0A3P6A594_BRACM|nr:unnamed protein product [Brassica napus]CAG7892872.1 unnamed protein product [Brassica rapa]VDC87572.1 unnamed protein product [Brassica rapa]